MSDATKNRGNRSDLVPRPGAAAFGLLVALGSLFFIAFVAPDDGPDAAALQQGIVIAVVIAAVPIAVIVRSVNASRVVSLGGAMTAAGVATMFGGNLAGLLMAVSGLPILFAGAAREPAMSSVLLGRLLGYTVLLVPAMWLSVGDTTLTMKLIAAVFAGIVATSPIWDPARPE